jgi:aminoglycoside phosphotransferase family enzyme
MSRAPTLQEKVAFLKRPSAYAGAPAVGAIETHFAWVFLAGSEAWKLKKPLRHRHMDYRSIAARRRGCIEEVRLNRRLAPGVYRCAVPLTLTGGRLSIGGQGRVVDWLIRMRRLPDAAMLDHALRSGSVQAGKMDRLAKLLLRFYESAPARPLNGARYLERLSREIRENQLEIGRCADHLTTLASREVRAAQIAALARLRRELASRGAHVVDGHGDLRAEHVYLGPRMSVIDALEFDPRLRWLDPAEEVSLLALEIERLGQPRLADRLLERFRRAMTSPPSPEVFAFYKSHRAATRAKLAAWHIGDPQFPDAAPWVARTESLLADALRYAQTACGADSVPDRRPVLQQRRERRAGDHPVDGFGEEWGHMHFR